MNERNNNPKLKSLLYRGAKRSHHSGLIAVYTALGAVVFLGISSLVVDMGFSYWQHAETRKAADAAALAAAWQIPNTANVDYEGKRYTHKNGFIHGSNNTTVTVTYPYNSDSGRVRVHVSRPARTFFAGILGMANKTVSAAAVAQLINSAQMDITGVGQYGKAINDAVNLAVFGPNANRNNGDQFSPILAPNGTANQWYNGKGYDFVMALPNTADYYERHKTYDMQIEIFDPDCYNVGNGADANGSTAVDELRTPSGGGGTSANATTTQYQLVWEHRGPSGAMVRDVISTKSWGNDSSTDMKWVQDPGFKVNLNNYTSGRLILNVLTTSGSSENGFDLRAGPPHSTSDTEAQWITKYGTEVTGKSTVTGISSSAALPMNFNISGQVSVKLGYVPANAAGSTLKIGKFDTDVGNPNVYYTCDGLPGTFPGVLSGNGTYVEDSILLPSNYVGGTWTAHYQAGQQDTSVWSLTYSAATQNSQVFLIE